MYNLAIRKCTTPPLLAPKLKIFKKRYYPAGDRTLDLVNQRQTCYHLSQRGEHALRYVHGVFTAVSEIYAVMELCENARIYLSALPTPALLMRPDALKEPNARTTPT